MRSRRVGRRAPQELCWRRRRLCLSDDLAKIQPCIPSGLLAILIQLLGELFADHLSLYRQPQIYSRQGIELDRSTLATWSGKAAFELKPVFECLLEHLKTSTKLFMGETRAPALDPGRRKTKTGYFWTLARDDRPWNSGDPPGVAYNYVPGRGGAYAESILEGFTGILQVDGYAGYNRLTKSEQKGSQIELAYCWPPVSEKSPLGESLLYIARFWKGLTLFLSDGRIEMDNNAVERTIRPIALNRKNALFTGHDTGAHNWGIVASLIETAKLIKIKPHAYLTATLQAIVAGHKQRQVEQLLPWNFVAQISYV